MKGSKGSSRLGALDAAVIRFLPHATFLVAILLSLAGGPALRLLARPSQQHTPPPGKGLIKVTHIIFNHDWVEPNQGPPKNGLGDALSIRTDLDVSLSHGPFADGRDPDKPGSEAGAGEWIVDPNQDGSKSTRNDPALYLRKSKTGKTSIFARFEATANIKDALISFAPTTGAGKSWAKVAPTRVKFQDKKDKGELNKYANPPFTQVSQFGGIPNSYIVANGKSLDEWVELQYEGDHPDFPDDVRRSTPLFNWIAEDVNFKDGSPALKSLPMNTSGFPVNPADPKATTGHELFTVLDTPKQPWYDTSRAFYKKTFPWATALREVTDSKAAEGAGTLEDAGKRIAGYLHMPKGLTYDTVQGAPNFVQEVQGSGGVVSTNRDPVRIGIQFSQFLKLKGTLNRNQNRTDNMANCNDYAASQVAFMNLVGAGAKYRFKGPYGYSALADTDSLGECNNPFFNNVFSNNYPAKVTGGAPYAAKVDPSDLRLSRRYAHHSYAFFGGKVYDAMIGPDAGLHTEDEYWQLTIDIAASRAFDASAASTVVPNGSNGTMNLRGLIITVDGAGRVTGRSNESEVVLFK